MEREVGEFLNLLGLSASAEDKKASGEADAEKDQHDECDEKFHHGWGHSAGAARVVSDDESGDNGHCAERVDYESINECSWYLCVIMSVLVLL